MILYHFIRYPLLVIPFHHLNLSSSSSHSFILFESFAEFHSLAAVFEIPSLSQESERPFFSSSRERESCSFISVDFKTRIQKGEEEKEGNRKEKKEWSIPTTREKEPIVVRNIKRKFSRRRTRVNFFEKRRKTGRKEEKKGRSRRVLDHHLTNILKV